jgi:hypothetical protein
VVAEFELGHRRPRLKPLQQSSREY